MVVYCDVCLRTFCGFRFRCFLGLIVFGCMLCGFRAAIGQVSFVWVRFAGWWYLSARIAMIVWISVFWCVCLAGFVVVVVC